MKVGFPWSLIEPALVGRPSSVADVPWTFRDASMLGLVAETPVISYDEFQRAIDRRTLRRVRSLRERDVATAVVVLSGRQIGALGTIVPTGRTFSALAHVVVRLDGSEVRGVVVEAGLVRELTACGVRMLMKAQPELSLITAAERADLLDGDASATHWARAWRLPPRLARLAVLLMAGLSPRAIAERARLSLHSVRSYTEELFARAGVHCRSELAPAALRDGSAPRPLQSLGASPSNADATFQERS